MDGYCRLPNGMSRQGVAVPLLAKIVVGPTKSYGHMLQTSIRTPASRHPNPPRRIFDVCYTIGWHSLFVSWGIRRRLRVQDTMARGTPALTPAPRFFVHYKGESSSRNIPNNPDRCTVYGVYTCRNFTLLP